MATEAETKAEADFLELVRQRYKDCIEAEQENRDRAREALKFRDLEQWDERARNERQNDPEGSRPCLVVDKLNQHVQQVVNDERQNRPQIKVRPVDNGADIEVAKIYDGLIRHIQDRSHADIAYDTAFEQAVDGGFGFWRIVSEYCDPLSFEQDLVIKRIRNRFSTYLDPQRQEPDGSDARYGFILYKDTKKQFKAEFGVKGEEAIDDFSYEGKEFTDWYGDDWVIYAEYFWIEQEEKTLCLLSDGRSVFEEEAAGVPIVKKRKTHLPKVRWRKLTATKILEEGEWAGTVIPIVEVVGNELDIEGRVRRSGMIRTAMDAQRVDNYATSAFVENVALAPRASYIAASGQVEGYEEQWRTANRRNISTLFYKPVAQDGVLVPPPQRVAPPGIPAGWLNVLQQSEHNIEASMGRYASSVGAPSNEKSGRAILARQREGDVGSFHFSDNLSRSLRHTGRILIEVIPKYYDTKRVARIIGEDGTPSEVTIDPGLVDANGKPQAYAEVPDEQGNIQKIYNLNVGKYDVTVSIGASFTTRRLESAEAMMEVSKGNPEFLQSFGDIIFKAQDWPGADQIAARFKKMLPPQLLEDEETQKAGNLERQKQQIQEAARMLGEKEAQLQASEQQIAELAQQSAKVEQAAKDAIAKAQGKVNEINEAQVQLAAERQVLAAEKREAAALKKLAESEIARTALIESEKIAKEAMEAERALVSQREQELTFKGQFPPDLLGAIVQGQERLAQVVETMSQIAAAPTELILDENGEPIGSRKAMLQ